MTPERFRQIEELYHSAREREPNERAAFLAEACRGDEELRQELDQLLAPDSSSDSILDSPAADLLANSSVAQLATGTQIGPYRIEAALGAGGMGEVYRAVDTRLDRKVAIKISSNQFSERFEREARAISSLNHPHICTLYDVGPNYLVMELVEGETLAATLKNGKLSIEDTLRYGGQIAAALAEAHSKGITHRDLKPGNVMIGKNGVKVLDFGLAKSAADETLTVSNAVMGTPAYMAPEQLEGKTCDARTDIYALGLVLLEMATDTRLMPGQAAPLEGIPEKLAHVIERCLAKDPEDRWQSARDAKAELDWIARAGTEVLRLARADQGRSRWRWVAAGAVVAAVAAVFLWLPTRPAPLPSQRVTRFSFALPKEQAFTRTGRHNIAISPDGSNIVYVANRQLYLKTMANLEAKPIPGTAQDVNEPFFSPDGRWVGFFVVPERKLKKIATTGGAAVTISDLDNPFGASWYSGDQILVGQGQKGIVRLSSGGGKPETVITVREGETADGPQLLPSGDAILFTVTHGVREDRWDKAQIVVQSLRTGERKVLVDGGSDARYVPTGHIVYALGSTVYGILFDPKKMQVIGGPVPLIEGVLRSSQVNTAATFFSFSNNGSLVYIFGGRLLRLVRNLTLVDLNGVKKPLAISNGYYFSPRISPDGRQLAVHNGGGGGDEDTIVWIYELSGAASMRRLTFGGSSRGPVWTRDGQRIIFGSNREGDQSLFWQRVDGIGSVERLTMAEKGAFHNPESLSPDGKVLLFTVDNGTYARGIWMLRMDGDRKPQPLIEDRNGNQDNPVFSPDGHWIAYQSNENGQIEIFVQPFPTNGTKYQITIGGGRMPVWSPNGKQIFYFQGATAASVTGRIVAVDVRTQPNFTFSKVRSLPIEGIALQSVGPVSRSYDVMPDGKQFIVMLPSQTASGDQSDSQVNVVLNWFEELKQRVPAQ